MAAPLNEECAAKLKPYSSPQKMPTNANAGLPHFRDGVTGQELAETFVQNPAIGQFDPAIALTPEDALLRLVEDEFAAIALDVQMPGTSGLELASLIKQRKRTQDIPIIFLTAFPSISCHFNSRLANSPHVADFQAKYLPIKWFDQSRSRDQGLAHCQSRDARERES